MDLNDIRKLVRLMDKAELLEIEIEDQKAGTRVHLKRGDRSRDGQPQVVQYLASGGPSAPTMAASSAAPIQVGPGAESTPIEGPPPGAETLTSPMVGTFYRSPSPDSDSFVEPGSTVDEETVICIIEAMKVMNEIKAELKGEIVEILVENGEPVEFGQPLFYVKKG